MATGRRPIFELHIRPMFRLLDQIHMLRLAPNRRIDLWDYQQVRDRHQDVFDFLDTGSMPPVGTGGPWPREWIDLFVRWKETGFGRLARATTSNLRLAFSAADRYVLSASVSLPDSSAAAWFEIVQARPDAQIYEAVMEQVEGTAPAPTTATIEERIRGPLTVAEVVVIDAAGEHRLAVPTS